MNHFIIYSHGFGVRQDDRGLFTDISRSLQNLQHIMFDYSEIDERNNTLTACPLDEQAEKLKNKIIALQCNYPDVIIDVIAHSQGCVAAAIAKPSGIRKVIFLAPPAQFLGLEKREIYAMRPDTITENDGTLRMPRRDGSTTIIRENYWRSREGVVPIELYNQLARLTNLTIITATNDEVLTNTDFTGLSDKVSHIKQPANHDFTGDSRRVLIEIVSGLLRS
ncbi:MAG: hypothetical protein WAQ25_02780 [Candidatus Saccharimonas sp.]